VIITGGGGGGVYACDDANDGKWYWFFCGVLPIGEKMRVFQLALFMKNRIIPDCGLF
jgi:hypothetical protein